jgi:putative transposase
MPNYRRAYRPGGTFFITQVTEHRAALFLDAHARALLHASIASCRQARPFTIDAIVLLPDHLHMLLTLPEGDGDFSKRLGYIKAHFTRAFLASGGAEQARTGSRRRQGYRAVWQRRFYEHTIRDEEDLHQHVNYIHYNPVKHGLTQCPHEWPHSTFEQFVKRGVYSPTWCCVCNGPANEAPTTARVDTRAE